MDWLSLLIGALAGWLIAWLIDILVCRPRRKSVEADLRARLAGFEKESASLKAQLGSQKDAQVRLGSADAELNALRAQLAGMKDLQVRFDGANAELDALKVRLAGCQEMQVNLDNANLELDALRAELAGMKDLKVRLDGANVEIASLKAGLDASQAQLAQTGLEIGRPGTDIADRAGSVPADLFAAADAPDLKGTLGSVVLPVASLPVESSKPDDLTIVEGIGPKLNALLNQHGIYTFAQLAAASLERLQAILSAGGPRFSIANPATWAEQAALARDGAWEALQRLQDSLKGGQRG